jgi:hypothetical protein
LDAITIYTKVMKIFTKLNIPASILFFFLTQITSQSQTDTVVIKQFPGKFNFIDYNNDGYLQRSEIDYVVDSYLDNTRKYPNVLVKEFVTFYQTNLPSNKPLIDTTSAIPKKIEPLKEKVNKIGMAILPVGSEFALGVKYNITKISTVDARLAKPNYTVSAIGTQAFSFATELFYTHRVMAKPKVKFNLSIGARAEYSKTSSGEVFRYGIVTPLSVEAFPFAVIPNGALFFEIAAIYTTSANKSQAGFLRSASGFCIYF